MLYITPVELAELPGAVELAQVATAAHQPVVDDALMEATLRGTDRSDWDPDEIAVADDAMARIAEVVAQAESFINGFLVQRGYSVPLSPVPKLVTGWTRDIARYTLHKDRLSNEGTDPILRAYRDAQKMLQMIVEGKFGLGAEDPIATKADRLDVRFNYDKKAFSRRELREFR